MSRVFFTSDLHFGHKNLCEGIRGMTVEKSDQLIINNWNKVITKRDIVYILGDVVMEKPDNVVKYLSQLNGQIRIVGGNHDTRECCEIYHQLGIPVLGCLKYKGFLCTHVPAHPYEVQREHKQLFRGNIHGHIHCNEDTNLGPLYYNVNTELHNYTPIAFDDLVSDFMNRKEEQEQFGGGYKIQKTLQESKQILETYD